MIETKNSENGGKGKQPEYSQMERARVDEVMCWKDPNKTCKCDRPQLGVFCGRYPIPTD